MVTLTPGEKLRRAIVSLLLLGLLALSGYIVRGDFGTAPATAVQYQDGSLALVLTTPGQLWNTSFQHPPTALHYNFNGSANPHIRFLEWHRGVLGVGVNNPNPGQFYGYFAETKPSFPSGSFVQTVMTPYPAAAGAHQVAETIVAVQTANTYRTGLINYVIVSYTETGKRHMLQIGYANGRIQAAKTYILHTVSHAGVMRSMQSMPITVSTNGNNAYRVWLGDKLLYQAHNLRMHIAPPFQVYLEGQSRGTRYVADFRSLAVYRSDVFMVTGLKPASRLALTTPSGTVLTANAGSKGDAAITLPVNALNFPATIRVREPGVPETVFRNVWVQGGDVYRLTRPSIWSRVFG